MSMETIVMGVVVPLAVGVAGWGGQRLYKIWNTPEQVDELKEDLKYVRERVDNIYDALIDR